MQKDSKIYVAGHRGLVGSAIVSSLKDRGYSNIITRTHSELDLANQSVVNDFFKQEQPEYVILAAAKVGGIVANNTYRADFIYENIMIQNNVIHASYENSVKKLLFLGSTCIYPKNAPQPMAEDSLLTSELEYTNEPYAIAKIAGIKMCESYNIQYGTNFISVMPTNLYGPNDNFDLEKSHVLPALIRKIYLGKCLENDDWKSIRADLDKLPIEGVNGSANDNVILTKLSQFGVKSSRHCEESLSEAEADDVAINEQSKSIAASRSLRSASRNDELVSVEIWGSGKPMREFLWSEDMADACVFIMENRNFKDTYKHNVSEVRNTHINIDSGVEISIKELAETIKETIGFAGELLFNDSKPDGTMRKLTDVSKLHALGWQHKVSLSDGVKKLFQWYVEK